ncbi:hypothetical protein BROUX41_003618 [Berkeleyomyces rouxiae]|uniref:uncharacterized protein n=1 Tax=Berkeleyomyces rouxiae TaxID=2035830 RepID=UPI003B78D003
MAAIPTDTNPIVPVVDEEVSFVTASDAGAHETKEIKETQDTKETETIKKPAVGTAAETKPESEEADSNKSDSNPAVATAITTDNPEPVVVAAVAVTAPSEVVPPKHEQDNKVTAPSPVESETATKPEAVADNDAAAQPEPTVEAPVAVAATETPATTETTTATRAADAEPASEPEAEKLATPLEQLTKALPSIIAQAQYAEMWGIDLKKESVPTTIVLQKFLRANEGNVDKAEAQLTEALKWRREINPIHQLESKVFEEKFASLGYVTVHEAPEGKEQVIAWNIYGAVKDKKATFGNVEEFIIWRSAFMELSLRKLKIDQATEIIPDGGEDPYQMIQVHDYKGVSFLRMDSDTKAATAETIKVLSTAYPELLSHKYFVNVPSIMGFVFSIVKRIVSPATVRKFHPMSSGATLAAEVKGINLPKEYGGSGPSVTDGFTVKLAAVDKSVVGSEEAEAVASEAAPAIVPAAQQQDVDATPVAIATTETAIDAEAPAVATAATEQKEDKQVTEKSS